MAVYRRSMSRRNSATRRATASASPREEGGAALADAVTGGLMLAVVMGLPLVRLPARSPRAAG